MIVFKVLAIGFGFVTAPFAIVALMSSSAFHPAYRMHLFRRWWLGLRMFYNGLRVRTATSFKAHLAMAQKIFEIPPEVLGDVVECGTWKGGSAANLSLVCRIVGRRLWIFDSFEGLPEAVPGDREAHQYRKGDYCGQIDEVKSNIRRYGAIEVCEFEKGWFEDTLPSFDRPVILAFVDVDLEASLHTCVLNLWPRLTPEGYLFIDEAIGTDYAALFYSERWWERHFGRTPPGLIGAGSGLSLGEYYLGPHAVAHAHPMWRGNCVGYTQKCMSGVWTYVAPEVATREPTP